MAITPKEGYQIDPNNPNGVVKLTDTNPNTGYAYGVPTATFAGGGASGTDVAGKLNIPATIPVDNLGKATPTPPAYTPPIDTTNHSATISGAVAYTTPNGTKVDANGDVITPSPTSTPTPNTDAATSLVEKIKGLFGMDTGKTAYAQQQEDLTGVTELQTKQNQLTAQANALAAESKALQNEAMTGGSIENKLQLNAEGRGITTGGLAPLLAGELRKNQIKQADLASRALTVQSAYALNAGDLATAKETAKRAVDLKYADIESQIENSTKLLALYTPFMNAEQTAKANAITLANEEKKTALADKKKQQTDVVNAAQTAGDSATAAEALKLDPNSSTFTQDLAKVQSKVTKTLTPDQVLDQQYKKLQIQKLQQDLISNGVSGQDADTLIAYANQYASTGAIPTGLPKGTLGAVANLAKELPKANGEIVDNNTNIRSGKLTSTQTDAYSALKDLSNKLDEAKILFDDLHTGILAGTIGSIFPSQKKQAYDTLRGEIVDLLARARTGAAISATEEALYKSKVPSTFNNTFFIGTSGDTKLTGLKSSIEDKLDAGLRANGVSMYGFSTVKLSDGKEHTVGEILNVNGHQGRVNPDGSITQIN